MSPKSRVIIDTDPVVEKGVDDILALLLAFSAKKEELEVLLVSLTFGNIDVQSCLRNTVALFHWIDKEIEWRTTAGLPVGFEALRACRPLVSVGAEEPLADQLMMADYFHGTDGLGGIHSSHPHLTPTETWKALFTTAVSSSDAETVAAAREAGQPNALFTPSTQRSHIEMLRLLRENEPDTISIVAIGPLTNCALAAAADPEVFLRAKELIVMGGTIAEPGNITPVAEFNTYADSIAAARVYALTNARPETTMPTVLPGIEYRHEHLNPYPQRLSKTLDVALFPLDITTKHELGRDRFDSAIANRLAAGSPLVAWVAAFLGSTFDKIESLAQGAVSLALHDPLAVWYAVHPDDARWRWATGRDDRAAGGGEDIRVETAGQWTRGMCIVDRRDRRLRPDEPGTEVPGDAGSWLGQTAGNRIRRCVGSPGEARFAQELLERIFD